MLEAQLQGLLDPLFGNRVFWDALPDGYVITAPIALLQKIGGRPNQYLDNASLPSHKHARVQVRIWSSQGRLVVAPLARTVENTLLQQSVIPVVEVIAAPVDDYDDMFKLYGCYQQFAFWYPDP